MGLVGMDEIQGAAASRFIAAPRRKHFPSRDDTANRVALMDMFGEAEIGALTGDEFHARRELP